MLRDFMVQQNGHEGATGEAATTETADTTRFAHHGAVPPVATGSPGTAELSASDQAFSASGPHHRHGHAHAPTGEQIMEREAEVDGDVIAEASARYNVPEVEIRAIITQESRGNAHANAGARQRDHGRHAASGLMQVTAATWHQTQHAHPELAQYDFATYRYDRRINILFGAAILHDKRHTLDRMGVDTDGEGGVELTTMAYNAGEGIVSQAYHRAVRAGSRQPDVDCLHAQYLMPAIRAHPAVYAYYLTGAGARYNPHRTVERAVELKFREISRYPRAVEQLVLNDERRHPDGIGEAGAVGGAEADTMVAKSTEDNPRKHDPVA